ncbi:MAG: DUF5683 domain-containing protein [Balneolaceae bacterium]
MRRSSFLLPLLVVILVQPGMAQVSESAASYSLLEYRLQQQTGAERLLASAEENQTQEFPEPRSVMLRSLMVPGWGQITNKQAWKVPIIYGLFAGVTAYTIYLDGQYRDYRAAFFNAERGEDSDFRFGPTPDRLLGVTPTQLRSQRNSFRNRRDFMFIVIGLTHLLNVVDAYVFAHMRSFDVSDDLSLRPSLSPAILASQAPGVSLTISLNSK